MGLPGLAELLIMFGVPLLILIGSIGLYKLLRKILK